MRRRLVRAILCGSAVGLIAAAGWGGAAVPLSQQLERVRNLREVASIVFAVMGAWIALVYPKALAHVFGGAEAKSAPLTRKLTLLFAPMKYATIIVAYAVLLDIVVPLVKQYTFLFGLTVSFRRASYATLTALACLLLWSLLLTLLPVDDAEEEVTRNAATAESADRRRGGVREE